MPKPPFDRFKKDSTSHAKTPKGKVVDARGVRWTIKLGEERQSDIVVPRLAWALGFGAIEAYYVGAGRVEGITRDTDLGRAKGWILPDGSLRGGARFKRKEERELQDSKGKDITWDLRHNPGVPPEHLSGLRLFNVLVNNWDIAPKNCKIVRVERPLEPVNLFYISDFGGSLGGGRWDKYRPWEFQNDNTFIKGVDGEDLVLDFRAAHHARAQDRVHQRIPISHARWFARLLARLTDDGLRAAFDAAYATDALNLAYASGSADRVETARMKELSPGMRAEIDMFVAKLRARIQELRKVTGEAG